MAKSTSSGTATRLVSAACSATYSANEPQWVKPGCCWSGQTCALPPRHHSQRPHPHTKGTVTRSPTSHRVTPGPTSTTSPASSCPGTCGKAMSSWPAHACQSLRHIPVATTRTTTPPAGAEGRVTFLTSGCDIVPSTTTARMRCILRGDQDVVVPTRRRLGRPMEGRPNRLVGGLRREQPARTCRSTSVAGSGNLWRHECVPRHDGRRSQSISSLMSTPVGQP